VGAVVPFLKSTGQLFCEVVLHPNCKKLTMGLYLEALGQWQRQQERELHSSADELAGKALNDNSSPENPRAMCMHLRMHC
jgi:hypothetical protein